MKANPLKLMRLAVFCAILVCGGSAPASEPISVAPPAPIMFHYEDDFETERARTDSYSHARFFQGGRIGPEEIYLAYGNYPPRTGGRPNLLLFFHAGGQPNGAWLGYELLPAGAAVLRGSIEFDRPVPGDHGVLWMRLSNDGMNWLTLGESRGGEPVRRHAFTLPPGAPARFLELRGAGGIDNLRMSIEYVPEPAGLCLLAFGAKFLLCRRAWTKGDIHISNECP